MQRAEASEETIPVHTLILNLLLHSVTFVMAALANYYIQKPTTLTNEKVYIGNIPISLMS